jgi:hypothetical protein
MKKMRIYKTNYPNQTRQNKKLNDRSVKNVDLINTQIRMGKRMDGIKELMEIKMEENKERWNTEKGGEGESVLVILFI